MLSANFSKIGAGARLPTKLVDDSVNNELWKGEGDKGNQIYELRNGGINGTPLQNAPTMAGWQIKSTVADVLLNTISPEDFSVNPVLIIPPQGIFLNRNLEGKGYVRKIQRILEFTAESNTTINQRACLGAMIHERKIQEIRPHIEQAGYTEISMKGGCFVFVHDTTKSVRELLAKALKIE